MHMCTYARACARTVYVAVSLPKCPFQTDATLIMGTRALEEENQRVQEGVADRSTHMAYAVMPERPAHWTDACVYVLGSLLPRLLGTGGADCFLASPSFRLWSAPGLLCSLFVAFVGAATVFVLLPFWAMSSLAARAHAPLAQVRLLS